MLAEIKCPFCQTIYKADIQVNTRAIVDEQGDVKTIKRIRKIRKLEDYEIQIIEAIEKYISEDTTVPYLQRVLRDEFSVCQVHINPLIEKIKECYGLYSPDGKRLCAI